MKHRGAALVSIAVVLAACSGAATSSPSLPASAPPAASASPAASPSPSEPSADLTVFGAASLKGVLDRAKATYEVAHPGTTLTISTDSSAALATQIEQGAPADVFLSADRKNAQTLVDGGFAAGDPVVFATNTLTVIVPTANPGGVSTPADLAKDGLKVVAAGDEVPITTYANQLVDDLAGEPGYPADFAAKYAANIVSKEDNVKAVVAKIELGEGDAAIAYVTDAAASSKVTSIAVPETANVPATYAGVVVKASPKQAAAADFLAWFAGPGGQAILSSFGFLPPP